MISLLLLAAAVSGEFTPLERQACAAQIRSIENARSQPHRSPEIAAGVLRGYEGALERCLAAVRQEEAIQRRADEAAKRNEETVARDRATAEPASSAPPVPPETQDTPPPPRKLTAAERKAASDRRAKQAAAREAKKADMDKAVEDAKAATCGSEPKRSGWDGIPIGLKDHFKRAAHDPESVEFEGCTASVLKNPPLCWVLACDIRAKNPLGAKFLRAYGFSKTARGWRTITR